MVSIDNLVNLFKYYKLLGEKTIAQITEEQLFIKISSESNSIAIIVHHLSGNMLSRWTDFLTSDGEKEWRNRDEEFDEKLKSKGELMESWEKGWSCLFHALENLKEEDLDKIIYIRNMGQTALDAIHRQLAHYAYHVGQIVFIGKAMADENWVSLSIPKGNSSSYNAERFSKEKTVKHFTEDTSSAIIKKDE